MDRLRDIFRHEAYEFSHNRGIFFPRTPRGLLHRFSTLRFALTLLIATSLPVKDESPLERIPDVILGGDDPDPLPPVNPANPFDRGVERFYQGYSDPKNLNL